MSSTYGKPLLLYINIDSNNKQTFANKGPKE